VLEIVADFDGDTFRAVYTVRFAGTIYVLHAFQRKSKRGIATPKGELAEMARGGAANPLNLTSAFGGRIQ
jgi:phage-related protein